MSITIHDPLQHFIEYLQFEKRYSQHTIISYKTDLHQFVDYLQVQYDGLPLERVAAFNVRSWLADMKAQKISSKSLNRKISSLKSFYKFMMRNGLLSQSPMATIVAPKVQKRLPAFVAEADMQTLQQHVEFKDDWNGITAKLVIEMLYGTGMRLNELITLKEANVDVCNRQVKVFGKGSKERIIPVSASLVQLAKTYINLKAERNILDDRGHLFVTEKGKSLYPKYVYNAVTSNLHLVTTLHKKSPHILRHTFATHLTNNGADLNAVKELLGHASLAATQVYTHNTIDKLKNIHKQAHPKA